MSDNKCTHQMSQFQREEYVSRINRVIDYIESHIDTVLTLDELAQQAHFSKYHFHRIFRAFVGETLNQFIQRVRVERAATQLLVNPKKSITEIALDCGFSSSATFARFFKESFNMSARQWREMGLEKLSNNGKVDSNIRKTVSKNGKDSQDSFGYIDNVKQRDIINSLPLPTQQWRSTMLDTSNLTVEVKNIDPFSVAYVRHIGPYKGDSKLFESLFTKLFTWAGPRGLLNQPDVKILSVYHDSPEITDEAKLRTSVCVSVPEDTAVDGEIGKMTIAGGNYAFARFEINGDEYEQAWNAVYSGWLPDSGYQPDDRPCFELCHNNPKEHPEGKHILDICVAVKPL